LEPHDVGSEYAVYMVGPPAKSAFWQAAERAGKPVTDQGRIDTVIPGGAA